MSPSSTPPPEDEIARLQREQREHLERLDAIMREAQAEGHPAFRLALRPPDEPAMGGEDPA